MFHLEGRKFFHTSSSIPSGVLEGHIKDLSDVFNKTCKEVFQQDIRTTVRCHLRVRVYKCDFVISFGIKQSAPERMEKLLKQVVAVSIATLTAKSYQKTAERLMNKVLEDYKTYKEERPKF